MRTRLRDRPRVERGARPPGHPGQQCRQVDKTVSIEELPSPSGIASCGSIFAGPFIMAKEVLPVMREQGGGCIVNIASTAAKTGLGQRRRLPCQQVGTAGLQPRAPRRGPQEQHQGDGGALRAGCARLSCSTVSPTWT